MAHINEYFQNFLSPGKTKREKGKRNLKHPRNEKTERREREKKNPKGLLNSVRIISTDFFSFLFLYKKKGAEILFFKFPNHQTGERESFLE